MLPTQLLDQITFERIVGSALPLYYYERNGIIHTRLTIVDHFYIQEFITAKIWISRSLYFEDPSAVTLETNSAVCLFGFVGIYSQRIHGVCFYLVVVYEAITAVGPAEDNIHVTLQVRTLFVELHIETKVCFLIIIRCLAAHRFGWHNEAAACNEIADRYITCNDYIIIGIIPDVIPVVNDDTDCSEVIRRGA